MVRNGSMLWGTTAINSLAGWMFWMLAARTISDNQMGLAIASINAMTLSALVASCGIGYAMITLLPRIAQGQQRAGVAAAALTMTTITALLAVGVQLAVLPRLNARLGSAITGAWPVYVLVGTVLLTWFIVIDQVFVAHRAADGMLVRNSTMAVCKVLGLGVAVALGFTSQNGLIGAWFVAAAVSLAVVVWYARRRLPQLFVRPPAGWLANSRAIARPSVLHHIAQIGGALPGLLLPVVVLVQAGSKASAHAYVAWMICGLLFAVSSAVSSALFAEGSHADIDLDHQTRTAARTIGLLLAIGSLGLIVVGRPLLGLFGSAYASEGYPLLILLLLAAIPDAVANIGIARWRVRNRLGRVAALQSIQGIVCLGAAWIFVDRWGAVGLGWAFVASQTAIAAVLILVNMVAGEQSPGSGLTSDPVSTLHSDLRDPQVPTRSIRQEVRSSP